jgi:DNA-binding MarR family transcriptional regulator
MEDLFLYRIARLHATAGAPVVRICEGGYGITRREWRLLLVLALNGNLSSFDLAQHAQLEWGLVSKAVGQLVAKELIFRQPKPNDRRSVLIGLTEKGVLVYQQVFPKVVNVNHNLLSVLSDTQLEQLDTILSLLQKTGR